MIMEGAQASGLEGRLRGTYFIQLGATKSCVEVSYPS